MCRQPGRGEKVRKERRKRGESGRRGQLLISEDSTCLGESNAPQTLQIGWEGCFFLQQECRLPMEEEEERGEEERKGEEERSVLGEVEDDERKQGELRERRCKGGK